MALDLLIEGGLLIDGTGAEPVTADVGIRRDRIVSIGATGETARKTIDARGKVVSPGFVDVHTHYDAQMFWDPSLSPSSLHGVTTVVCGNCGYSVAPLTGRDDDRDYIMRMLAKVEGMPLESLAAGLTWGWTSFGDYLARLDGKIALNAAFLVGHSTLRRAVMGGRAASHTATDDEVTAMQALLRKSIREGGFGLSSTIAHHHVDGEGVPVPSCHATDGELLALARVVGEFEGTALEFLPNIFAEFNATELERMTQMSLAAGRVLNWNLLLPDSSAPQRFRSQLQASDYAAERGAGVLAIASCQPPRARINLVSGEVFEMLPEWQPLLSEPLAERMRSLRDSEVRARLAFADLSHLSEPMRAFFDFRRWRIDETFHPANRGLAGRTLGDVAGARGCTPLDALIDIALTDALKTVFMPPAPGEDDESWRLRGEAWLDGRTIVGGSDAGAHLDMLDTFAFTTKLLGEGVRRRRLLSLPQAIRQITQIPADYLGLERRGVVREGYQADLVVFDPDTVDCGPVHSRFDLPSGAPRLFAEPIGVSHVIVNGTEIARDGQFLDVYPGAVLRPGADTHTVPIPNRDAIRQRTAT